MTNGRATCTATRWLSIVGIGEDGADGLSPVAQRLIASAELVVGGGKPVSQRRHPFAFIGAIGEPTRSCNGIHHGQSEAIGILATLLDLAKNVIGAIEGDLDVDARIGA